MTHRRPPRIRPAPARSPWPSPRDSDRLRAALTRPPGPCLLCGARAAWRGIWHPSAECNRALGAPSGKTRIVVYSLCAGCNTLSDAVTRVEDCILADAAAFLASSSAD